MLNFSSLMFSSLLLKDYKIIPITVNYMYICIQSSSPAPKFYTDISDYKIDDFPISRFHFFTFLITL